MERQPGRVRRPAKLLVILVAVILAGAGVLAYSLLGVIPPSRAQWVVHELATQGYDASLSPELPLASFGSMAFRGPFIMEAIARGGPVDLWLTVNGEGVLRALAYDLAYAYPFETAGGSLLSADLLLSLPRDGQAASVSIRFSTPVATAAPVFHSGNVAPGTPPDGLLRGPVAAALTASPGEGPVTFLGFVSFSIPLDADYCEGASGFRPRGLAWMNVTAPQDARYYYEVNVLDGSIGHLVMGDVVGDTVNHLHWVDADFDLFAIICKPSTFGTFQVDVDGPT